MIAIAALASCFSGCGEQRFLITLKCGDEVLDTILTNTDGVADPWAKDYPKAGYEFVGWYKEKELKNEYNNDRFWGNGTLYCKRESLEYTVTFMLGGGEFPAPEHSDSAPDSVEKPTRPDEKPTEVRQTPVLDTDGNYTLNVHSGETLLVANPEREHYDFLGWRCNGELVDETEPFDRAQNVTYIAVWQPHRSAVTYDANGGTIYTDRGTPVTSSTARQYVDYDAAFTPYTAEKKGYTFGGWWYTTAGGQETELKAADKWQTETNFAVSARFTPNEYNIAIVTASEAFVHQKVTYDAAYDFTAYAQAPDGYIFDCWEYELDGVKGTVSAKGVWNVAGQVTLTPRYNANDYKLTLIAGGEVCYTSTVAFGSEVVLPEDPTQSGKVFVGWFAEADGSGERLLPGDYWRWSDEQEKTFYARFANETDAIGFTVEYYVEKADHTGSMAADIYELRDSYTVYGRAGETITVDVSGFGGKYEHCAFDAQDALNAVTKITLATGTPATLKFYFKRETVRYSFIDDGDIIRSREYRIGQTIDLSDVRLKKGYELTGWRTEKGEFIAADAVYRASDTDTVLTAVWQLKTYAVSIDGKYAFDVEYGASLTDEMKNSLMLEDTNAATFDGLNGGGGKISPDELAAMRIWELDGGKKTADGKYAIELTSLWKARKANYTVELWLEDEKCEYVLSDDYSFMKSADIGKDIEFKVGVNIVAGFTAADGTVYVFNAEHPDNVLTLKVADDNSAAVRLYYDRAAV